MISIYSIAVSLFVGTFLPPPFLGVVWYLMPEPDYHDMYYDANNKEECESIGGAWEAFVRGVHVKLGMHRYIGSSWCMCYSWYKVVVGACVIVCTWVEKSKALGKETEYVLVQN